MLTTQKWLLTKSSPSKHSQELLKKPHNTHPKFKKFFRKKLNFQMEKIGICITQERSWA